MMDDLSTQHLDWLRRQNDRSPQTIQARARVLRAVKTAGTITREQLETWFESRAHLSTSTRAADRSHLRGFYEWAQAYDHRTDNPMARVRGVRVNNRIPKKASKAQMETLLSADLDPDTRRAFLLGGYAGMRVAESAALDWADVDDDANTITVREGKGGTSRVIDVSPLLIDWLGERHNGNVVSGGRKVYGPDVLQRRLNRAIKRAGVDVTTHSLRHRWGMVAYQSTGDLVAVSEMMGHKSITTTTIYAQASSDVKKKIASAVMR